MRIGPTLGVSILASRLASSARTRRVQPGRRSAATGEETARSRALVVVEPAAADVEPAPRLVRHRTDAAFLAQLVANAEGFAETRRARRAEPEAAIAAYERMRRDAVRLTPGWLVDVAG